MAVACSGAPFLLEFNGVSKVFTGVGSHRVTPALRDVNFGLRRGEFLTVIGPSGCGKTTILRLAAGLEFPSAGSVQFGGTPVRGTHKERGLVSQSYSVFPWLTVRGNMATGLDNLSRTEREDRIARWLDATGLREFADSYPKALSGGMRQRLALARTMATLPELVLLDEPLGALDEYTRLGMQKTLSSVVHAAGTSAVMVTHSIQEALLLSDRVLLMSDHPGSILADFSVITRRPRSSDFLKSPEYLTLHESIMERFPNTNN